MNKLEAIKIQEFLLENTKWVVARHEEIVREQKFKVLKIEKKLKELREE